MTMSAVQSRNGEFIKKWQVTATQDGDTQLVILHGFAINATMNIVLTKMLSNVANWSALNDGAGGIILTKSTDIGSADAAPQLNLIVVHPHSVWDS